MWLRRRSLAELLAEPYVGSLPILAHQSILISVLIHTVGEALNVIWVAHVLQWIPSLQDFFLDELMRERAVQLMACEFIELHVQYRRPPIMINLILGIPLVLLLPF